MGSIARPPSRIGQRGDDGDSHQPREHFSSEFQPVQPTGLSDFSPARRVTTWGARGVRVGETQKPSPDDVEQTQLDSGARSSEESKAPGLTVRQESDTESVGSINIGNNEVESEFHLLLVKKMKPKIIDEE